MNVLVHIKPELRNLVQIYQIKPYMALWDKIGQIWPKVEYNMGYGSINQNIGPTYVIVSRYDQLWP